MVNQSVNEVFAIESVSLTQQRLCLEEAVTALLDSLDATSEATLLWPFKLLPYSPGSKELVMDFVSTLALTLSLAAGVSPNYSRLDGDDYIHSQTRFFMDSQLELSAFNNLVFVGAGEHTESLKIDMTDYTFAPVSEKYTVTAGVRLSHFELSWEHYCLHPVETSRDDGIITDRVYGSADTFYVKWHDTFKF